MARRRTGRERVVWDGDVGDLAVALVVLASLGSLVVVPAVVFGWWAGVLAAALLALWLVRIL